MMIARALAVLMLIASLTLIADSRSAAAAPAVEKIYIVNSNQNEADANLGDGICETINNNCTLHAAIDEANSDGSPSRIKFEFKMTISPNSFLGVVEDFTVIDASDQWDGTWPYGNPGVTITGNLFTVGLLLIQGDSTTIRGIDFSGVGSTGIYVDGSKETVIGGTEPGQRNVFSIQHYTGNTTIGVEITGGASKTDVRGNYFGTLDGF